MGASPQRPRSLSPFGRQPEGSLQQAQQHGQQAQAHLGTIPEDSGRPIPDATRRSSQARGGQLSACASKRKALWCRASAANVVHCSMQLSAGLQTAWSLLKEHACSGAQDAGPAFAAGSGLGGGSMQRDGSREIKVAFSGGAAPPADLTGMGRSPIPEIMLERRASRKQPLQPLSSLEEDE